MAKKFTDEELYTLEKFASRLKNDIESFKKDTAILKLQDEQLLIHQAAIEILDKKFGELINATSRKKLNKVIDVDSIIGESDEV